MTPPILKKVCLISLGCPKNLVDAEMMLGFLKKDGFDFTVKPEEAEVIVVNTCGFVEDSKKESIEQILEMAQHKKNGKCQMLVATGCLSQRYSKELSQEMPEVDLFVGLGEFDKLSGVLKERFIRPPSPQPSPAMGEGAPGFLPSPSTGEGQGEGEKFRRILLSPNQILPDPDLPRILATPKHYSYLKISEGCSHRCSFCIIPHIRGDLKSRPIDSIVREVREFVVRGVKEFNLIAQDLNEYGKDLRNGSNLSQLLTELNKIEGDFWLRPLYMYPLEFTDRLIGVLRDSEHIVKYVDMPLQHINDRIMRSMKRGSPSRYVRQVLTKLKTAMPEIAIRTTFIVGYPGETEEEFQELYNFLKEYEFDRVGVFKYSVEEGTPAALLTDQLSPKVKEERYHRLMSLQQKISLKKNQSLIGKIFRVLCDVGATGRSPLQARLPTQAPEIDGVTYLEGAAPAGNFANVKIVKAEEYDLFAKVV
jgi:ribosomal protein S12 methylthiotransferase